VTYSVDKVTVASALVEALQPFEGAIDKLVAAGAARIFRRHATVS
jgi:hypothetical protein